MKKIFKTILCTILIINIVSTTVFAVGNNEITSIGDLDENTENVEKCDENTITNESNVFNEEVAVQYQTYIQEDGWIDYSSNEDFSNSIDDSKGLEAIKIKLQGQNYIGDIKYRSYIQDLGWQDFVVNGQVSGTEKSTKKLEAIEISLTDEMAENYDIYYRVYTKEDKWSEWVKNGEIAGSENDGKVLNAIEIKLVNKTNVLLENTDNSQLKEKKKPDILYRTHVQDKGWQNFVSNGILSGTEGEAKRLEAIQIKVENSDYFGDIKYRAHVQDIGWQNFVYGGQISGTEGLAKRLEAIEIDLTDELAKSYDIYYRVHVQDYGWLDWAKNGQSAGSEGYSKRLEAIEMKLVNKGENAPGEVRYPFIKKGDIPKVVYRSHVQNIGWQGYVNNGEISGTQGNALRVEALQISLQNSTVPGSIKYRSHVQDIGWQNFVSDGQISGTEGQAKRVEAVKIELTGILSINYDIYYRVHIQDYGWLDWAKNGQAAGSEGLSKRIEAIEIKIIDKGNLAPGNTNRPFIEHKKVVIDPGHNYGGDEGAIAYMNGVAYYERDLNMKVSLYLKEYLEGYGYNVVLTRQPTDRDKVDVKSSLARRVNIANSEKADVFISVHHNSFPSDSAYGTEVYYYNDTSNISKRDKSRTLATNAVNNISRNTGFYNRGAKTAAFTVIERTNMPGILVEGGFMSNANELKSLLNDSIQRKIAKGIADAVRASF